MSSIARARVVLVLGVVLMGAGPAGWVATDVLERDNDFCNACHIEGDVPLHIDIRRELDTRPPTSLAARHAQAAPGWRPADPVMRCFDCHSGTGVIGRARIKAVAARDLGIWLLGRAEEPHQLSVAIVDRDCTKCHDRFSTQASTRPRPPFHSLPIHAREVGVACVGCHPVHESEVDPDFHFLAVARVQAECARCHRDFDDASNGARSQY